MARSLIALFIAFTLCCAFVVAHAAPPIAPAKPASPPAARQPEVRRAATRGLEKRTYTVDGVARESLLAIPPKDKLAATGAPVVFVFHGHGGSAENASRQFALHTLWPEALIVYPLGLPTPGRLTDPEGKKNGWQSMVGDQGDRDLKFFDVMLAALEKECAIDRSRVYCTGHSNGGGFTYLLWLARPDVFAAVAPSAAAAMRDADKLKPLPAMHLAGEKDPLVRYEWQVKTMDAVQKVNGCSADGKPYAEHATIYESPTGTPLVRYIHGGGHEFAKDATPVMVRFFKEHAKTSASTEAPTKPGPREAAPGAEPTNR